MKLILFSFILDLYWGSGPDAFGRARIWPPSGTGQVLCLPCTKKFFLMTCFLFLLVIEYNLTGQGMDRCYDFESSASAAGPGTLLRAGFTTCDSPVFENIYI